MSSNNQANLKYPSQVYSSVRVDTNKNGNCSDYLTDFELCKNFNYFMEDKSLNNPSMPKIEYPADMFEMKTISDGSKFYKAKQQNYCYFLKNKYTNCYNSISNKVLFVKSAYQNDKNKFGESKFMEA